jgi:hypothetical protein
LRKRKVKPREREKVAIKRIQLASRGVLRGSFSLLQRHYNIKGKVPNRTRKPLEKGKKKPRWVGPRLRR